MIDYLKKLAEAIIWGFQAGREYRATRKVNYDE
jgi:hypothetical protein